MGILTEDMKRVVRDQYLGYVATVCPDGTPNLSPKGTLTVWDDDHLVFADKRSPNTTANIRHNPVVEVNVVDPFVRKGYRFKGRATILEHGEQFETIKLFFEERNANNRGTIKAIILVEVERALELTSPGYDLGFTEEEITQRWKAYYAKLYDLILPEDVKTHANKLAE